MLALIESRALGDAKVAETVFSADKPVSRKADRSDVSVASSAA